MLDRRRIPEARNTQNTNGSNFLELNLGKLTFLLLLQISSIKLRFQGEILKRKHKIPPKQQWNIICNHL